MCLSRNLRLALHYIFVDCLQLGLGPPSLEWLILCRYSVIQDLLKGAPLLLGPFSISQLLHSLCLRFLLVPSPSTFPPSTLVSPSSDLPVQGKSCCSPSCLPASCDFVVLPSSQLGVLWFFLSAHFFFSFPFPVSAPPPSGFLLSLLTLLPPLVVLLLILLPPVQLTEWAHPPHLLLHPIFWPLNTSTHSSSIIFSVCLPSSPPPVYLSSLGPLVHS